ncbi:MAG: UDP-N-acetylmuramoyl-L-alanyl-D-glutamate--2,6-diaminopimelate ligase [Chlamydiae bacterium]|nr:UDP-N-acetylmuramoyl-L-alanyl-D-glutamate--2,6-diaminopimelate ligase [Chlamydiota bacterium]
MKLKKLIETLPISLYKGGKETEITGLCSDSRQAAFGDLFIAKKGSTEAGVVHIEEALASGAAAILTDTPNPFLQEVAQLLTPDIAAVEPLLAKRFYQDPSHSLSLVGVTGTNGKTTTSYLIQFLLEKLGVPTGLVGTIEYRWQEVRIEAERTTPDVITNHKLLREMVRSRCDAAVVEVSSHGLAQGRVDELAFQVGIFTNLSHDHLDYHKTMEAYAAEKAKLFSKIRQEGRVILNLDSPWIEVMEKSCSAPVLTYGIESDADLKAENLHLTPLGSTFTVSFEGETVPFTSLQIGRFNVSNTLAAIGACLALGFTLEELASVLPAFPSAPGRLERVENSKGFPIFVDYAHTPDALEKVLSSLRELTRGKIYTIIGCGGDRDFEKRPLMGRIASKYSDFAFLTSDNPRSEDPFLICEQMAAGIATDNYMIQTDRREAIRETLSRSSEEDLILIAGKGHETYQTFAHQTVPFDDRQVVKQLTT